MEFADGRSFTLGSDGFGTALDAHRVVAVEYALGTFLVIAERRTRGDRYWVARAYHHGRRASVYIGREFDAAGVRRAADGLAAKLQEEPPSRSPADSATLDAVMRDLIERERDPTRRAAAEAIAALVRRDHAVHRA
jgi:hypothetical protein